MTTTLLQNDKVDTSSTHDTRRTRLEIREVDLLLRSGVLRPLGPKIPNLHFTEEPADNDPAAKCGDVRQSLIVRWADIAVRHATVEPIEDPDCLFASIAGIDGPWGIGQSEKEAIAELHSVLIDWATLKLDDGDRDIPDMEGIRLVVDS